MCISLSCYFKFACVLTICILIYQSLLVKDYYVYCDDKYNATVVGIINANGPSKYKIGIDITIANKDQIIIDAYQIYMDASNKQINDTFIIYKNCNSHSSIDKWKLTPIKNSKREALFILTIILSISITVAIIILTAKFE